MDTNPIIPIVSHLPETRPWCYDIGGHVVEVTNEGGLLLAAHVLGKTSFREAVSLDQDETYRLFLVLQEWFMGQQTNSAAKGHDQCS